MGACSTVYISRSAAKKYIIDKMEDILDEDLENLLNSILRSRGYNTIVVEDLDDNNDIILERE